MKLASLFLATALLGDAAIGAVVAPASAQLAVRQPVQNSERDDSAHEDLWKRKGGGGGGGRGGGGSSSGGSSSGGSSSGGSSSSGSSSGGSSSGAGRGGTSGSSGAGTRPVTAPTYGGGRYYGGGAATPYRSGGLSPSGLVPILLVGSALAFWPGVWLAGAHMYHYNHPYQFYNQSANRTESKPVDCACAKDADCGCDENSDKTYMNDLIGNGTYDGLNKTLVNVADVNGTSTILINGTLPDGTASTDGNAAAGLRALLQHAGWWPVVATVCAIVFTA